MAFTVRHPRAWFGASKDEGRARSGLISTSDYIGMLNEWFSYQGHNYPLGVNQTLPGTAQEPIANDFVSYVRGAYKANGIVFACILARMSLFAEARFQFRRLREGKPQDLFGSAALAKLERPWKNGTTGDLLARMEQDNSAGGNSYTLDRGRALGLRRLRPDWTTIVLGNPDPDIEAVDIAGDPQTEVVGYAYTNRGPMSGNEPQVFRPELVAHYAPIPDPEASFRGMSWITPVVTEIMGDKAATEHKLDFFERGGTPNMTVEYNPEVVKSEDDFTMWMNAIEQQIAKFGPRNRRLHLGGGTKATVVGSSFEQIEFKATQGAGETRIAAAAGVPAPVVGISEGLQGSSLNAGNYQAAMRRFADMTLRPLWRNAAGSLETLITVPPDAELWYDDDDIAALRTDRKDHAEIRGREAETIARLRSEGFTAESVVAAVTKDDWSLLKHDGSPSVQTRPAEPSEAAGDENGTGDSEQVAEEIST